MHFILKNTCQVRLVTFPMLHSHMWRTATTLDSADTEDLSNIISKIDDRSELNSVTKK